MAGRETLTAVVLWSSLVAPAAGAQGGQDFPSRPARIVTSEIGGGADAVARIIAHGLTAGLGQQVIVDNRGGSVVIPAGVVAKAAPDGHTVLLYPGTFWVAPLMQSVNYDLWRDFRPVSLATTSPVLLAVHPSVAAGTAAELISLAREKPGQLNYGSGATGSSTHLAAELFMFMSGVKLVRIPYKGAGPAVTALVAGQVHLMLVAGGAAAPHVKSGRLKALAVTTGAPSALFPGLPTVAATGLPGFEFSQILGVFAPAATPTAIVNRLSAEIAKVVKQPEYRDRLVAGGVEAVGGTPPELAAAVKSETARMGKVIRDAGIRN